VRSTTAPYTESRLTRSVANERVGFPVVEHMVFVNILVAWYRTLAEPYKYKHTYLFFVHKVYKSHFFMCLSSCI
jgi:hypothetical protein